MDAAKRPKNEEYSGVGAARIDGTWCVRDRNAASGAGNGVDGVVARTVVRDEFQAGRKDIDYSLIEAACNLGQVPYISAMNPSSVVAIHLCRIVGSRNRHHFIISTISAFVEELIPRAFVDLLETHDQQPEFLILPDLLSYA